MIQILGDRVLVALPPEPEETITASGLFVARDPDREHKPTQGIVVQVGEKSQAVSRVRILGHLADLKASLERAESGRLDGVCCVGTVDGLIDEIEAMTPAPFDVALGDCVLFPLSAGEQIHLDGVNYVILREDEILGIVEKSEAA